MKRYILFYIVLSSIIYYSCSNDICSGNGHYDYRTEKCICDHGYVTYNSENQCNYKQKSQIIAFILHIFLFVVGAGEWYLGNILLGFIPIFITMIWIFNKYVLWIILCRLNIKEETIEYFRMYNDIICSFCLLFWFVIDLIYIADGTRVDHNGVPTIL